MSELILPNLNCQPFFSIFTSKSDSLLVRLTTGEMLKASVNTQGANKGDRVVLGVRPEDCLAETDKGNAVEGKVQALERLGSESYILYGTRYDPGTFYRPGR